MDIKRINAWSSPRNVSTALMYAFARRSDTAAVDEPLYAHYLSRRPAADKHPGREEILRSQENDGEKVVREVILGAQAKAVVFFKQMTHHLVDLDWGFLAHTEHVLLIRDPRAIIASYAKVIEQPDMDDIGVAQQYALFQHLRAIGRLRAVIDARELLLDPEGVLRQLCARLGLPFEAGMLSWPAGPRPEDGVWAKYWYANVHRSTGFQPYEEKAIALPERLEALAAECRPYYEALLAETLRAGYSVGHS
jgi:hypothetical protein